MQIGNSKICFLCNKFVDYINTVLFTYFSPYRRSPFGYVLSLLSYILSLQGYQIGLPESNCFWRKKKQGKSHFGTTNLVLKTLKNTHTHTHTGLFLDDQFAINYRFKPFHNIFLKFNMCYALKPIRIDAIKINPPPKKKMLLYFETKKQHNWSQENYLPILKIILKQMLVPKMLNNIS